MSDYGRLALADALSDVGYREGPRNSNKFAAMVGAPNYVSYCAIGAAKAWRKWIDFKAVFPLPWYVPSIWNTAKAKGWTTGTPKDGDLVIYDWGRDHVSDHVGIAYPSKGSGYAVEYNTSPSDSGSQSNGGGVFVRRRPARNIQGFVSMSKVLAAHGVKSSAAAPRPQSPAPLAITRRKLKVRSGAQRMRGEDVKEIQRFLGVKVDGSYGPDTAAAVKRYQRMRGIEVDGVVGSTTWTHIKGHKVRAS